MRMRSTKHGSVASEVEVLNISVNGIWLLVEDREYFLSHEQYPWFKDATISQIQNVEFIHGKYLRWEELDGDLGVESLSNLERFPLVFKHA
jgi:hypothetical protein